MIEPARPAGSPPDEGTGTPPAPPDGADRPFGATLAAAGAPAAGPGAAALMAAAALGALVLGIGVLIGSRLGRWHGPRGPESAE